MKQDSTRQSAANRARIRRLREQYNRRLVAAIIISFILGAVAGVFGCRWYMSRKPRDVEAPVVWNGDNYVLGAATALELYE